ncbi:hypothetical protein [Phytohabitans houttuyneae]|nr:hypothetical protein [Phytohabitans houttuyneae]
MATAGHVLDAVELLEPDHRIQVVFTQAPDLFDGGVREYLRSAGAVEIGWEQATHTDFDLMIAADSGGVHRIRAPWLAIAHGVMNNKLVAPALGGQASHLVTGLGAPWLTWYGRLLPAVLAVSHDQVLPVLSSQCPEALSVATVVGDLCLDRLASSRPNREMYRQALAVPDGRRLVAISSTWGRSRSWAARRQPCSSRSPACRVTTSRWSWRFTPLPGATAAGRCSPGWPGCGRRVCGSSTRRVGAGWSPPRM